jgi:hypothetical protein
VEDYESWRQEIVKLVVKINKPVVDKRAGSFFSRLIIGWCIAYFVGILLFPSKFLDSSAQESDNQSFIWNWLQSYLAIFGLVSMAQKDLSKKVSR